MSGARLAEAGDAALLLEFDPAIDPSVNARVVAAAACLRAQAIRGVTDVVPTIRSVAVYFDPGRADVERVRHSMLDAVPQVIEPDSGGRLVEVPVHYGGDDGPDLPEVAAWSGLDPDAVVRRHAGVIYRVYMLGFLPGFPYLGTVDASIAVPRRERPRMRVAAGSVGIAGGQTGIYPVASPGGWQVIGRSGVPMFDAARIPPAWLAPGDQVRFVPVEAVSCASPMQTPVPHAYAPDARRRVVVHRPGLLTSIQDRGRHGHQTSGVSVSGAMDREAHDAANALVGNAPEAATLEATIVGPELHLEQAAMVAIAGADLGATIDGVDVPAGSAVACRTGATLRFSGRRSGCRAYIAFDGGIDVPPVLGSRATHMGAGLGPLGGRALVAGDALPLGPPIAPVGGSRLGPRLTWCGVAPGVGVRVRVLPGPQSAMFPRGAFEVLEQSRFTVTPQSNRMGYRLGGAVVPSADAPAMISDAAFTGGLQIPPSGEPIVLMADRQTTGGYPQIGVVITADLPAVAQLAPGDWIEFAWCSMREARAARSERGLA